MDPSVWVSSTNNETELDKANLFGRKVGEKSEAEYASMIIKGW